MTIFGCVLLCRCRKESSDEEMEGGTVDVSFGSWPEERKRSLGSWIQLPTARKSRLKSPVARFRDLLRALEALASAATDAAHRA